MANTEGRNKRRSPRAMAMTPRNHSALHVERLTHGPQIILIDKLYPFVSAEWHIESPRPIDGTGRCNTFDSTKAHRLRAQRRKRIRLDCSDLVVGLFIEFPLSNRLD